MKAFLVAMFLGASIAQASVDYVAIGELANEVKEDISQARAGVACMIKDYAQNPTCAKIENVNRQTKALLDSSGAVTSPFSASCGGQFYLSHSVYLLRYDYLSKAQALAMAATPNDPVHGVLRSLENSIDQLNFETIEVLAKAKLQETYVSTCLLGNEPQAVSILQQLCQ